MNIAELLKYCAKGTKLYSTIWGEVELSEVTNFGTIEIKATDQIMCASFTLDYEGRYSHMGECILFPSKSQRNWEKFRLPVKRGDIMMIPDTNYAFIATGGFTDNASVMFVCGIDADNELCINPSNAGWTKDFYIPASEKAKKKLFDKLKEHGYEWNSEKWFFVCFTRDFTPLER